MAVADPFDKVAGRIATFVRLLSSDRDGEVLAAVAAMVRTLRSAGVDIHALAQRIEQKGLDLSKIEMQKIFDAGFKKGHERGVEEAMAQVEAQKNDIPFHDVSAAGYHAMAVFCQRNYDNRSAKEREFIEHMVKWTKKRSPTEKQSDWLEDIYDRLGGT